MLRNLALLALASALALAGAELAVRALVPQVGWRLFPDVGLGWSSREYRDFDPTAGERVGERTRVLFLGDSHLAGAGNSSLDARFPVLLGEAMADRIEVAVLASGGWGTDQQLLAYLQKGRAWQPDLVVLAFCPNNDLANILSNRHVDKVKPYFVLEGEQLRLYTGWGEPADLHAFRSERGTPAQSYLLDLLRFQLARRDGEEAAASDDFSRVDPRYLRFEVRGEKLFEIRPGAAALSWAPQHGVNRVSAYVAEDFETNRYQWALFSRLLAELDRVVRADGAELVVMLLPVSLRPRDLRFVAGSSFAGRFETPEGPFTFRAAEPRRRLREIGRARGIEVFDPSAAFVRELARRGLAEAAWDDPGDPHLSDAGHRLLAELTRAWLVTRLAGAGA